MKYESEIFTKKKKIKKKLTSFVGSIRIGPYIGAARATVLHEDQHQLEAIPKPSVEVPSLSRKPQGNVTSPPLITKQKIL